VDPAYLGQIAEASNRLAQFRSTISLKTLIAACSTNLPVAVGGSMPLAQVEQRQFVANQRAMQADLNVQQQARKNAQEFEARSANLTQNTINFFNNAYNNDANNAAAMGNLSEGVSRPCGSGKR
jgi:hypothetical protein